MLRQPNFITFCEFNFYTHVLLKLVIINILLKYDKKITHNNINNKINRESKFQKGRLFLSRCLNKTQT